MTATARRQIPNIPKYLILVGNIASAIPPIATWSVCLSVCLSVCVSVYLSHSCTLLRLLKPLDGMKWYLAGILVWP